MLRRPDGQPDHSRRPDGQPDFQRDQNVKIWSLNLVVWSHLVSQSGRLEQSGRPMKLASVQIYLRGPDICPKGSSSIQIWSPIWSPEVGQYIEKYWKTNILVISILILILKSAISKYWYRYWYWNLPFIYIATNIDIEKNMNIDIGIYIDIEEIKSIFVNFYGIFAGLTYIIFKTNCIQLPLWFCQKLEYLLKVFIIPLI